MTQSNPKSVAIVSGYYSANPNAPQAHWLRLVIKNHQNYAKKHGYHYIFRNDCAPATSKENKKDPFYLGAWSKPLFIQDLLEKKFDYVFWIDSDSIFTNFNVDFDDLISQNKDIAFTGDCYDVCNSGHLLLKNSEFSKKFINDWDKSRFINCSEMDQSLLGFETTHDGFARGDQTNFNALLVGPIKNSQDLTDNFNEINGFPGNLARKFSDWQKLFTPISDENIQNIFSKLIDPALKGHLHITKQNRLNAYVSKIENSPLYSPGDAIVHFVSNTKKYLVNMGWLESQLMIRGIYITPFIWHYPKKYLKEWLKSIFRA